jgi:hypothetical protein
MLALLAQLASVEGGVRGNAERAAAALAEYREAGRTICINPGSEYNEVILRGALVELKNGKLKSHQFTAG